MTGLKRFLMFICSLAGLFTLAALALPWVGPWKQQAAALITSGGIYFAVLEVLFCITALCLVILLFRALFMRTNKKTILVTTVDGGQITVSRDAIASQAAHIIEEDGTCTAVRVDVDARSRSKIKVHARVLPTTSIDTIAKGNELHARLTSGLAAVCGDNISSIDIEFEEPEEITSTMPSTTTGGAYDPVLETAQSIMSAEPLLSPDETGDITVNMTAYHAPDSISAESGAGKDE